MNRLEEAKQKALKGDGVSRDEALWLFESDDLTALCRAADEIRDARCGNAFDLCSIVNGKCGRCSEDCRFCAQSARYPAETGAYPLLAADELAARAKADHEQGVRRFSIVTAGRTLSEAETEAVCAAVRAIREACGVSVCGSHGLLSYEQLVRLRQAGVARYHCNLEASRRFFPQVCTTHTYDDKIAVIQNAMRAGLTVCSGLIIGMGETAADRIDLALDLRALGVRSVPVNVLTPIPGTPFEQLPVLTEDEVCRTAAVFRFVLPQAAIRMAAGRGKFEDKGARIFRSGANAAITGDMLTTSGITVVRDLALLRSLGFEVARA